MSSPEPLQQTPAIRSWRACESCRRKKTKCDGKSPCLPCHSRQLECIYPDANDNAAKSRQTTNRLHDQYNRLDVLHERMEDMMTRLSSAVVALENIPTIPHHQISTPIDLDDRNSPISIQENTMTETDQEAHSPLNLEHDSSNKILSELGNLIQDSNGVLRYIGGVSNSLSINVARNCNILSTPLNAYDILEDHPTPVSASKTIASLFGMNTTRPPLYLAGRNCKPPPRYMSDVLVNLYFSKVNSIFPILHQASFAKEYKIYLNTHTGEQNSSSFRSILFAIYACASNILAFPRQNQDHDNPPWLDYFQQALADHYQSLGRNGLEDVQCLAILAMCSASWDYITESWRFAAQAVRAAQDIGLHVASIDDDGDLQTLQSQINSRVWWCTLTLDTLISTCLGRQPTVTEADYNCPLPEEISPNDVSPTDHSPFQEDSPTSNWSQMTGLIALAQVCPILNKINQFSQSFIPEPRPNPDGSFEKNEKALDLEMQLSEWIREKLPPSIQFAANQPEEHGGIHLTMCVITFMLHAISVINLNLRLINVWEIDAQMLENEEVLSDNALDKVITAARGIIRASELVGSNIPPSHYLAFCVHLLTISGLILFKVYQVSNQQSALTEVNTCASRLAELQSVYPGALERSRALYQILGTLVG